MKILIIGLIKLYQQCISPFIGPRCRFYPSCSTYALDSISIHGLAIGTKLTLKRLLRCHPFSDGGVDLVPQKIISKRSEQ